jgi:tetratricopeptide (TPR) repeat protein
MPENVDQLNELILSALPDPYNNSYSNLTCGFLDILTDDIETSSYYIRPLNPVTDTWYNANPYIYAIQAMYTWRPDYSTFLRTKGYPSIECYSDIYRKLVYVNSTLDYSDKVKGEETIRNYVKAQALALRGFYYLHLVNMYGVPYQVDPDGQGVPLRLTGGKENRPMVRNTVQEVYNQITNDLRNSIDLFAGLPNAYQYVKYRANMPMALLLLSRAYLYMGDWKEAKSNAQKLIAEWPQFEIRDLNQLVNRGITNLSPDALGPGNKGEARKTQIFDEDFTTYNNPDVIWTYGAAADISSLTGREIYGNDDRLTRNDTYAILTNASKNLTDSYNAADLRLRTYFVRSLWDEYQTAGDYNSNEIDTDKLKYRAYGKMLISDNGTGIPNTSSNQFIPRTDIYTFGYTLRITEAYLILAEAQAELGETGDAKAMLEKIMTKRFKPSNGIPAAYTAGDIKERVREERRREFCFEALRWFDLRRWGMPEIKHVWLRLDNDSGEAQIYTLEKNDPGYTLPIPQSLLDANKDLTQVPLANEGFERVPTY